MSGAPLLEIVCPVRNGGEPLRRTLQWLRESDEQGFRLTVSDNHSTDGRPWEADLGKFAAGQARLIRPPEPLGRVEHWSWAAAQAAAPYCKLLMVGDRLPAAHLRVVRPALEENPSLVFSRYFILEPGLTEEMLVRRFPLGDGHREVAPEEYLRRSASHGNFVGPLSGAIFRTDILRRHLPFDARHPWTADWRMFSSIALQGPIVECPGTYVILDRTIQRLSSSFSAQYRGLLEERAYRRELFYPAGLSLADRLRLRGWLARETLLLWARSHLPPPIRLGLGTIRRALRPSAGTS